MVAKVQTSAGSARTMPIPHSRGPTWPPCKPPFRRVAPSNPQGASIPCTHRPPEPVVQPDPDDVVPYVRTGDDRRNGAAADKRVGDGSEIDEQVFELGGPRTREHPLGTAAHGPSGVGVDSGPARDLRERRAEWNAVIRELHGVCDAGVRLDFAEGRAAGD